jgi:Ser/Thr protein kinase RdoA (MazF antagonist)
VNRVYKVILPDAAAQILRLSHYGSESKKILSELMVLDHLSLNTDLKVPNPIPNRKGQLYSTINEKKRSCFAHGVMFTFVSGEPLSKTIPSANMMFRIGRKLSQLDLALKNADKVIKPSPSKTRGRRAGEKMIDWSLSPFIRHSVDYSFLDIQSADKGLHPTISGICNRLRDNYKKLKKFLPHQLLHLDTHFDNIVFDGQTMGILDFDNLGTGPRLYELAAPMQSIYELNESGSQSVSSCSVSKLMAALLEGYKNLTPLSQLELKGFSLIQALRLFSGLGWAVSRQNLPDGKEWLVQYGAATVSRILALLDEFEDNLPFRRSDTTSSWMQRAINIHRWI